MFFTCRGVLPGGAEDALDSLLVSSLFLFAQNQVISKLSTRDPCVKTTNIPE